MSVQSTRHAKQRAKERFNFSLTPDIEADIINRIQNHELLIEKEDKKNNVTRYKTTINGNVLRVVYSHREKKIITVMESKYKTFYRGGE